MRFQFTFKGHYHITTTLPLLHHNSQIISVNLAFVSDMFSVFDTFLLTDFFIYSFLHLFIFSIIHFFDHSRSMAKPHKYVPSVKKTPARQERFFFSAFIFILFSSLDKRGRSESLTLWLFRELRGERHAELANSYWHLLDSFLVSILFLRREFFFYSKCQREDIVWVVLCC